MAAVSNDHPAPSDNPINFEQTQPIAQLSLPVTHAPLTFELPSSSPLPPRCPHYAESTKGDNSAIIKSSRSRKRLSLPGISLRRKSTEMKKEFTHIYQELKIRTGFPWEAISEVESPLIMEQLIDLYQLCLRKNKQSKNEHIHACIAYAIELSKTSPAECSQTIGEMIAVIDKHSLSQVAALCSSKHPADSIHLLFSQEITEVKNRLEALSQAHQQTKLQSPELAVKTRLPIEISSLLVTSLGTINIGIIEILKEAFIINTHHPLNHEVSLSNTLTTFKTSPRLCNKVRHMTTSQELNESCAFLIRSVLQLPPCTDIQPEHIKQAAVCALLSHERQGSTSTCFTNALAILFLSSYTGRCLDDFAALLNTGKLTRTVGDTQMSFPFLLKMSEEELDKPIDCKSSSLIEAPGIQAACFVLNIKDPKNTLELIANQSNPKTLRELLWLLSDQNEDRFALACFAFGSLTKNGLLYAWNIALSGMAETNETGILKASLLRSVMDILQRKGDKADPEGSFEKSNLKKIIAKELMLRSYYQYDPTIGSHGAFVLYMRSDLNDVNTWKRIDSPELFKEFILATIRNSEETFKSYKLHKTALMVNQLVLPELKKMFELNQGVLKVLKIYHEANAELKKLPKQVDGLPYTPWITKIGNNPKHILETYQESPHPIETTIHHFYQSQELLHKIIEIGRSLPDQFKERIFHNPDQLIPTRIIGVHTFSLMLGHSSFVEAWRGHTASPEWVNLAVCTPGHYVAKSLCTEELRQGLIQFAIQNYVSSKALTRINTMMERIPKVLSIHDFRDQLIKCLTCPENNLNISLEEVKCGCDNFILMHLPRDLKEKLKASAAHIADTNWHSGLHDIHFCAAINPGSDELEIMKIHDDNTHLTAIEQSVWLKGKPWEFYLRPDLILPTEDLNQPHAA